MNVPVWLHPLGDAVMLDVIVAPRASRTRIIGVFDNRLKIQIAAPPVDNAANDALITYLARILDVARAQIEVIGGPTSRRKTVRLAGVAVQRALLRLTPAR